MTGLAIGFIGQEQHVQVSSSTQALKPLPPSLKPLIPIGTLLCCRTGSFHPSCWVNRPDSNHLLPQELLDTVIMELLPIIAPHAGASPSACAAALQIVRCAATGCGPRGVCAAIGRVLSEHSHAALHPRQGPFLSGLADALPPLVQRLGRRAGPALRELSPALTAYAAASCAPAAGLLEQRFEMQRRAAAAAGAARPLNATVGPAPPSPMPGAAFGGGTMPAGWQVYVAASWSRVATLARALHAAVHAGAAAPGAGAAVDAEAGRALALLLLQLYAQLSLSHVPPDALPRLLQASLPRGRAPAGNLSTAAEAAAAAAAEDAVDESALESVLERLAPAGAAAATSAGLMQLLHSASGRQPTSAAAAESADEAEDGSSNSECSAGSVDEAAAASASLAAAGAALLHLHHADQPSFWGVPDAAADAVQASMLFTALVRTAAQQRSLVGVYKALALLQHFSARLQAALQPPAAAGAASVSEQASSAMSAAAAASPGEKLAQLLGQLATCDAPPLPPLAPVDASLLAALHPVLLELNALMSSSPLEEVRMAAYVALQGLLAALPEALRFEVKQAEDASSFLGFSTLILCITVHGICPELTWSGKEAPVLIAKIALVCLSLVR